MAHFAKVLEGKVVNVIVAEPEFFDTFIDTSAGEWIQTSFNTSGGLHRAGKDPVRMNFAGIGHSYDRERDAFIAPQPYPSWTLDEATCTWEPPVPCPLDEDVSWNEETLSWEAIV
jgi:hypothetical protein